MTMPTRVEILEELRGALDRSSNGRADLSRLDDEARIIEDVGLSSLDVLDLRCELEERWETKVTDQELMQMRTIRDIVQLIERRGTESTRSRGSE